VDLEVAISSVYKSNNNINIDKNLVKYRCADHIYKQELGNSQNPQNTVLKLVSHINKKTEENNIILTKADKGNSIVAINKGDYVQKLEDVIITDKCEIINKDPTNIFKDKISQYFNNNNFTTTQKRSLTVQNPSIPKLYGLIKLHKPDHPARPVVSYINAPAVKIAKYLNSEIPKLLQFSPKYSVKNSIELCHKLQKLSPPPNSLIVSFDVKNLFTNVPPSEVIEILKCKFNNINLDNNHKNRILDLTKICMDQNYFKFNNVCYKILDSLPMGNQLSPLLSEIYLDNFENLLFNSEHPLLKHVFCYFRYVDDIFCIFTSTKRVLNTFLNHLNSLNKNLEFTLEVGENSQINFLDLSIKIVENRFKFSIYRKPSYTDSIIHSTSNHPQSHKLASFHSMIHRLLSIPLEKEEFNNEIKIIKQIALNNGFDETIVSNIIKKKEKDNMISKFIYPRVTHSDNLPWRRIIYVDNSSYFYKKTTKNLFKTAFYTNNNLGKLIFNNKDGSNKFDNSGVYKITCNDCSSCYVGQTTRSINTRIKEHSRAFRGLSNHSEMADHCIAQNHSFDMDSVKVLHSESKYRKLIALETLEIHKNKHHIINCQIPPLTPLLTSTRPSLPSIPHTSPPPSTSLE
jgi:uncharacterized protein (UPF0335 family)